MRRNYIQNALDLLSDFLHLLVKMVLQVCRRCDLTIHHLLYLLDVLVPLADLLPEGVHLSSLCLYHSL